MIKFTKLSNNPALRWSEYKIGNKSEIIYIMFAKKNFWKIKQSEFMVSIENEIKKEKKSRAADMAKSRAKASFLRDVRLTPKAEANLKKLCESTGLNKTQVINKLLEEKEQLSLL